MDKELASGSSPESGGEWLSVWMEIGDKCCPQGSVPGLILFDISINYIDNGIKCIFGKLVDDTKLCGMVNMPKGRDAIQEDLDRLEQLAQENHMRFNKPSGRSCTWIKATPTINTSCGRKG